MSTSETDAASAACDGLYDNGVTVYPDGSMQRNNVDGEGAFTEDVALASEAGVQRYQELLAARMAAAESTGMLGRARAVIAGLGNFARTFFDKGSN